MKGLHRLWGAVALVLLVSGAANAAVVGLYDMETDTDAGATSASIPDGSGTAGASLLISASATIAAPGAGGTANGIDGLNDINGLIASYPALNSASITVEGYFRTNEGTATLLSRSGGTAGYSIANPNDVTVTFFVSGTTYTLKGGTGGVPGGALNLSAGTVDAPAWTKVAFSYNATTGEAMLLADDVLRGTVMVPGGGPMFVSDFLDVSVGGLFDGGDNSANLGGLIDQVRFLDTAVPEPTSLGLLGACALFCVARRRERRV
jgi:hypothetical protein